MACNHPLKAFKIGYHDSGKPKYKICSYDVEFVYQSGDSWFASKGEYLPHYKVVDEFLEIPCGKCIGCRLAYSREWANRCMLELGYHEESVFVTLTYDDDHLPCRQFPDINYVDDNTGEILRYNDSYSLCKRDLQLFFKRLRKEFPDCHIRYYACGEYGSDTFRPHYHAIIFGLKLNDLRIYKKNFNGNVLYNSERLSKVWQNKGHVVIGEVTWDSCAYVARYIMKKQVGDNKNIYKIFNIEPEFVVMSRRPGIGKQYYLDNCEDILYNQIINISTEKGGKQFRPPRYYDKLFDIDYPEEMEKIRHFRRDVAETLHNSLLRQIDIDYEEYLQIKENNLLARTKILNEREVIL